MRYLAALLLLFASLAAAQNVRLDGQAIGPHGPIPFVSVAVCSQPANVTTQPCTPLASLCSSLSDAGCTSPNPVLSDMLGNYFFYIKQGSTPVTIQIFGTQVATPYVATDQISVYPSSSAIFNATLYIGGGFTAWGSGDIGSQANTAYASCPSIGCHIHVLPQSTCYSFSTPIAFTTLGKPVLFDGDPGLTCLDWTPTTGTAITLDWGSGTTGNSSVTASGVRGIQLVGPGNTTTAVGLSIGPTNGAVGALIEGFHCGTAVGALNGFGTCVLFPQGLGFLTTIRNSALVNSGVGINVPSGTENIMIVDSVVAHNTTAGLQLSTGNATAGDVHLSKVSFDDNAAGIQVGNGSGANPQPSVSCDGCHFENGFVTAGGSSYVQLNAGGFYCYGCWFQDDRSSGTSAQMITASGNSHVEVLAGSVVSGGITITQFTNFSGTSKGFFSFVQTSLALQATFNTAYTGGPVFDASLYDCCANPFFAYNTGVQPRWLTFPEGVNPANAASAIDTCYGDSGLHSPKCAFNGGNFHQLPLSERATCTLSSGACTATISASFSSQPYCATGKVSGTVTGVVLATVAASSTSVSVTDTVAGDTGVVFVLCTGNPN